MKRREDTTQYEMDEILFASEGEIETPEPRGTWKVVIADDDEEVHALTRLVLSGFSFEDRGLTFLSAYTGVEAVELLRRNPDTALLLLDVVMEKEDAGLQAAKAIREELKNPFVRVILRTGQPGQAPERDVVANYDINDYKAKTDLTAQKLYTTVTAALRAYRDLRTIEYHRTGLELLNDASAELFFYHSLETFGINVLDRLKVFLQLDTRCSSEHLSGYTATMENGTYRINFGMGEYESGTGKTLCEVHGAADCAHFRELDVGGISSLSSEDLVFSLGVGEQSRNIIYIKTGEAISNDTRDLLHAYLSNAGTAYRNVHLNQEIIDTQMEMIKTLGETVEGRSHETARHVDRVAEYAYKLADLAGLDEDEAIMLKTVAPLHDVGKIGIPDLILNKPGRFDETERAIMKTHAEIGYRLLCRSNRELFRAASVVAHQHHERWDGSGYPRGLSGEDIHIYGRIVGLVDVVDALVSERVYKDAYSLDECLAIVRDGRGKDFDPKLVDIFLENIEMFFPQYDPSGTVPQTAVEELITV